MNTPTPTNGLATIPQTPVNGLGFPAGTTGLAVIDQINKADIVAIVRNEAEERYITQQNDANKRLANLHTKMGILTARIDEAGQAAIKEVETDMIDEAGRALAAAFNIKTKTEVTLEGRDDEHKRFRLTITLTKIGAASYDSTVGSQEVAVPYSKAILDTLKEMRELQKSIAGVQGELILIKREIANLPALERKAHATLASHVLNQSAEGQALLARLRPIRPVVSV